MLYSLSEYAGLDAADNAKASSMSWQQIFRIFNNSSATRDVWIHGTLSSMLTHSEKVQNLMFLRGNAKPIST